MSVESTSCPLAARQRERKPMPAPSSRAVDRDGAGEAGARAGAGAEDNPGAGAGAGARFRLPRLARYAASTWPPIHSVVPVVPVWSPFASLVICRRVSTASRVGSGWCRIPRCFVAEAGRGEALVSILASGARQGMKCKPGSEDRLQARVYTL